MFVEAVQVATLRAGSVRGPLTVRETEPWSFQTNTREERRTKTRWLPTY